MDEDVEEVCATRLVVLGVGGMGNNAMENLAQSGVPGLELYSLNTDVQALRRCRGSKPVQIGAKRTGGKGAGGNSDIGRLSAEDDFEKIRKIVDGAELAFIVSGMGGGTGSGAAPVVARICRDLGVLTVCAVTMPMNCEGPRREEKGKFGLAELKKAVDSLLIIENEKLSAVMDQEDVSIIEVFRKADKVVVDTVAAIARIIHSHGYINLDLADLKNVLQRNSEDGCVDAYIGLGEAAGPDRAMKASEKALNNPLLRNIDIKGAANLLVNVAGSEQIGHKEAMSAIKNVVDRVGNNNQEIFMGVVTDNSMGDSLCVTVIATGLPHQSRPVTRLKSAQGDKSEVLPGRSRNDLENAGVRANHLEAPGKIAPDAGDETASGAYVPDITGFSPLIRKEEWQIPAYLRNKVELADLEQMPHSRVRRIDQRVKPADIQPVGSAMEGHYRQSLCHMAG